MGAVINNCFKKKLEDINPVVKLLIHLFWTSSDVSSGFQIQSGQPIHAWHRHT